MFFKNNRGKLTYDKLKELCIFKNDFRVMEIKNDGFDVFKLYNISNEYKINDILFSVHLSVLSEAFKGLQDMYIIYSLDDSRAVQEKYGNVEFITALQKAHIKVSYLKSEDNEAIIACLEDFEFVFDGIVDIYGKVVSYSVDNERNNIDVTIKPIKLITDADKYSMLELSKSGSDDFYKFSFQFSYIAHCFNSLTLGSNFKIRIDKNSKKPLHCSFYTEVINNATVLSFNEDKGDYVFVTAPTRSYFNGVDWPSNEYQSISVSLKKEDFCISDMLGVTTITIYPELHEVEINKRKYKAAVKKVMK